MRDRASRAVLLDSCRGSASGRPAPTSSSKNRQVSRADPGATPRARSRSSGAMPMLERQAGRVGEQRRQAPQHQDRQRASSSRAARDQPTTERSPRRPPAPTHICRRRRQPTRRHAHDARSAVDPLEQVPPRDQQPEQRARRSRRASPSSDARRKTVDSSAWRALARGCRARRGSARGAARRAKRLVSDRPSCMYAGNASTSSASVGPQRTPIPGRTVQPATSSSDQRRREQAAAQVVEDLPARDRRQRVRHDARRWRRAPCGQSQRAICQSPRTQRCWRAANAR